jgi:AcrR family transcriptional regulator
MAEAVKTPRPYRSVGRAQQAEQTRARIRTAAEELFVAQGYAATSLKQVAERAGVAERTLYVAFPTKSALYAHALGVAIVGDEAEVPLADRNRWTGLLAEDDPVRMLRGAVDLTADLLDRAGDLILVGVEAAGADPEMRRQSDDGERATLASMRLIARRLAELHALRPGVEATPAADVLFTMLSPFTHHLLRRKRRWSSKRYRDWLLATLVHQLLANRDERGGE